MKKISLISLSVTLLLASSNAVFSQDRQRQTIRTSSTQINVSEMANDELQYLLPEKTEGTIYFKDGKIAEYKMNYNFLLDEVHIQTRRGRVNRLLLSPPFTKIDINDKTLVHDVEEGYLEQLFSGKINLYIKHKTDISTLPVKRGAYGGTDHTSSIQQTTIQQQGAQYHSKEVRLENPQAQDLEVTIRYQNHFVFEKNGDKTNVNSRRQLQRVFSEHRRDIRSFCRENDIDFDDPEDMIKVVKFIESLE